MAHYNELKDLHEMLDVMERGGNGLMSIQFWHVDRSMIEGANALANTAPRRHDELERRMRCGSNGVSKSITERRY